MAKDAITMFKEAAAQLQKEIEYVALDSARKMNDEDETLQELIGDFNLARIDLNSELSKTSGRDDEKVAALNDKVNRLYNDIMMNDSMQAYNDAKTDFDAVIQYVNAIINTAVNGGDPHDGGTACRRLRRQLCFLRRLPLRAKQQSRAKWLFAPQCAMACARRF